jgi:hypothetical protein
LGEVDDADEVYVCGQGEEKRFEGDKVWVERPDHSYGRGGVLSMIGDADLVSLNFMRDGCKFQLNRGGDYEWLVLGAGDEISVFVV